MHNARDELYNTESVNDYYEKYLKAKNLLLNKKMYEECLYLILKIEYRLLDRDIINIKFLQVTDYGIDHIYNTTAKEYGLLPSYISIKIYEDKLLNYLIQAKVCNSNNENSIFHTSMDLFRIRTKIFHTCNLNGQEMNKILKCFILKQLNFIDEHVKNETSLL